MKTNQKDTFVNQTGQEVTIAFCDKKINQKDTFANQTGQEVNSFFKSLISVLIMRSFCDFSRVSF